MINWSYLQQEWDWAGHILEAICIAVIVGLLFRVSITARYAWIAGLAFAMGHFHGREKRDHEIAQHLLPPHLDGYYIWNWSWDGQTDFWPAAIICTALIIWIAKRRPRG